MAKINCLFCCTVGSLFSCVMIFMQCSFSTKPTYVTVPGKRDQLGNFFQNRVIATAGKSRL